MDVHTVLVERQKLHRGRRAALRDAVFHHGLLFSVAALSKPNIGGLSQHTSLPVRPPRRTMRLLAVLAGALFLAHAFAQDIMKGRIESCSG